MTRDTPLKRHTKQKGKKETPTILNHIVAFHFHFEGAKRAGIYERNSQHRIRSGNLTEKVLCTYIYKCKRRKIVAPKKVNPANSD